MTQGAGRGAAAASAGRAIMLGRFRRRSYDLEHIDLGDYTAEEYEGCMEELRKVNRWLGDASALRRSVLKEIGRDGAREFTLLDVGAGTGELLREAARWARARGVRARLVGLELNARSAEGLRCPTVLRPSVSIR